MQVTIRILLVFFAVYWSACSHVEVVRLQPDLLHTPAHTEPLAALHATCSGFYFFTLGLPSADPDKAVNELLIKEARRLGAHRLIDLHVEVTPSTGVWWLTKLFWFRTASAHAIAVMQDQP